MCYLLYVDINLNNKPNMYEDCQLWCIFNFYIFMIITRSEPADCRLWMGTNYGKYTCISGLWLYKEAFA